jgi:hypothetical protein
LACKHLRVPIELHGDYLPILLAEDLVSVLRERLCRRERCGGDALELYPAPTSRTSRDLEPLAIVAASSGRRADALVALACVDVYERLLALASLQLGEALVLGPTRPQPRVAQPCLRRRIPHGLRIIKTNRGYTLFVPRDRAKRLAQLNSETPASVATGSEMLACLCAQGDSSYWGAST